jgi:hypothetical protein
MASPEPLRVNCIVQLPYPPEFGDSPTLPALPELDLNSLVTETGCSQA